MRSLRHYSILLSALVSALCSPAYATCCVAFSIAERQDDTSCCATQADAAGCCGSTIDACCAPADRGCSGNDCDCTLSSLPDPQFPLPRHTAELPLPVLACALPAAWPSLSAPAPVADPLAANVAAPALRIHLLYCVHRC